jgi:hypothetical protein
MLDYFDLSYQWYKGIFFLEHAVLVKGDRKLFNAKAIIDLKNQQINELNADLNKFPLNLVQLFVPNSPLILKTLQGSMKASLSAKGKFNQIYAQSSINLKKVNFQVPKGDDVFNIGLGKTELLLTLKDDRLALTGTFAKIFELEAEFPIKKTAEIKLGELQLKINNLSTTYLRAIPVNEESYLNEYKVLSTLVQNEIDFAPIPLMDATEGLNFLGLGKAFYCTTQSLALPNGQLAHLLLDGIIRLKFDTFFRVNPIISTSFNQFELNYWMRGDEGQLIQLPNTPPCASLCQNDVYMCPTISIRNRDLIQFDMLKHKDQLLAYFNPTQSMVSNTNISNEPQVASIENCNHFQTDGLKAPSFIPKTEIKAMPIILEGSSQNLIFGGYVYGDQINACTNASFELGVAYPFLNHIYQQLEGQSEILTAIYGKVSAPQVEGFLKLKEMNLLSPRSQVTGEIRLIDPLQLQISPLEEGGFFTSLPPKQEVSFNWDDGEIKIKGFQLKFPDFKFKQLLLDFSANQVELNLPEMVRLSAQLQDMRFEFLKNGASLSDQRMSLSGDIELLRGVYKANIQGANELNEGFRNNLSGRSKVQTLSIFERSPILKRLFLNLRVRGENDFFIRNQVAILQLNLEISMDLRIKGYLYALESDLLSEQLRLSGELKTLTGSKITYANRPFDVVDGIIRFGDGLNTGQTGNFLNANLEATHTFRIPKTAMRGRQLTVDQSNTGEMIEEEVTLKTKFEMVSKNAKPLIDFSLSSPSGASKLELATLVLTGRFPSKVNTATTSAQPATEVLLSPLLNLIERPIEDTLNLDLSLTPDTSGMLFVDLNKIFSRRLRLYARTPIGDDQKTNPQIFSLEYRFNNLIYGEISNDRINQVSSTSSRFRLRLSWENF